MMRKAFNGTNVIPQEIIWKPKNDIVDGIATDRFLPKIIKEYVTKIVSTLTLFLENVQLFKMR